MPFTVVHDEATRTVRAAATGCISRTDVIEFLTEHWARLNPDWALLFDTTASEFTYSPDDLLDFVNRTISVSRGDHPQFALVVPDEHRYRLVRRYQLRCDYHGCTTIDVFRQAADAEAWLSVSRRHTQSQEP